MVITHRKTDEGDDERLIEYDKGEERSVVLTMYELREYEGFTCSAKVDPEMYNGKQSAPGRVWMKRKATSNQGEGDGVLTGNTSGVGGVREGDK